MAEVPSDRSGEYQLLIESAGGEDIHLSETALPRSCADGCSKPEDLSPEIRSHLSPEAQEDFIRSYNKSFESTKDETKAEQTAWEEIRQKYDEDDNGIYAKVKVNS